MKTKILLFLILLCAGVFGTQQTLTAIKGNTIAATDTIIAGGNFTIDSSFTCVAFWIPSGTNYTLSESGTTVVTITGDGICWKDSTSGTKVYPDSLCFTGNGLIRISSGSGAITASSTILNFVGNDTLTDAKGLSTSRVYINGSLHDLSPSNMTITATTGIPFTMGNNATYSGTSSSSLTIRRATSGMLFSLGTGVTLSCNRAYSFGPSGIGIRDTVPAITSTGTGAMTFRSLNTADTIIFIGSVSNANGAVNINTSNNVNQMYIDLNDQNVMCGVFRYGAGAVHTTGWTVAYFGNGTITCSSFGSVLDSGGNKTNCQIFFEGAKIITAGNVVLPKNDSINPGTSTIWTTTTTSFTSYGQSCYDLRDSLGALTFADNPSILNDFSILSGNSSATTWSGYIMTVGGDFSAAGTGTLNLGNGITMTGNSALLSITSGVGTITGSSCAVTFNGTGSTLDIDKATTIKSLTLGTSASLTNSSGATVALSSAGNNFITLGNSASFTNNNTITMLATGNTTAFSLGSGYTYNGSAANNFQFSAATDTVFIPALTYSGSGSWTNNAYPGVIKLTGNVSFNTGGFLFTSGFNSASKLFTNGYTLTCGIFRIGKSAGTGFLVANLGSSTINCSSIDMTTANVAPCTLNIQTATINCSGNASFGTNQTVNPGSSILRATGTGTWTMNGKRFWDWRNVGSGSTKVTLGDSLQCAYFTDSSGKFTQNSKTIYVDSNYTNVSPDSANMSANIVIGKNYYRGTPTLVVRSAGMIILDTSKSWSHNFTASGNQIGPVVVWKVAFQDSAKIQHLWLPKDSSILSIASNAGIAIDSVSSDWSGSTGKLNYFRSSTSALQARLTIPKDTAYVYQYWKDICVRGGTITCPWDSGCRSGGGNKCP